MERIKKLHQYLAESERLKQLGLTDPQEFSEAYSEFIDEWFSDPEIQKAKDVLENRTQELFDKYIDLSNPDHEEGFEEYANQWRYESSDDIGLLEFILINDF